MSTDERHGPEVPHCGHCGTPFEPGHITCSQCGEARFLGGAVDGAAPPVPARPPAGPPPDGDAEAGDDPFDLGDPFREVTRRRERGPAQRSRTTLLVGGIIGLILVALVAAAALWALRQHGGSADF